MPAGRVVVTDRRSERRWQVDVEPFRLAAVPVTQAQFARVTGAWPSASRADDRPVEGVSWWDAVRFCNALSRAAGLQPAYRLDSDLMSRSADLDPPPDFLAGGDPADLGGLPAGFLHAAADAIVWDRGADGYRLPTEAEWEHACRAGTTGPRYGQLDDIAWYRGNSEGRAHAVGGKQPNAWGLRDMLGNVWDWCWDVYDAEVYGTYRVLRGGGWFDEHWSCRASVRRRSHPTFRVDDVGFRVARSGP
ncbi:MAG: formylglycine-generating enzyme family protein [Actinoplanes sp.]